MNSEVDSLSRKTENGPVTHVGVQELVGLGAPPWEALPQIAVGAPGLGVKEPVLGEEAPNGDGADPVHVEASVADESAEDELGRDGGVVTADVEEEGLLLGGERPRMAAVLAGIGGECGEATLQEGASPPEQCRDGEGAGDLLIRW